MDVRVRGKATARPKEAKGPTLGKIVGEADEIPDLWSGHRVVRRSERRATGVPMALWLGETAWIHFRRRQGSSQKPPVNGLFDQESIGNSDSSSGPHRGAGVPACQPAGWSRFETGP
jgi:hypothetical protein